MDTEIIRIINKALDGGLLGKKEIMALDVYKRQDQSRAILDTCRNDPDAFAHLALKASAERIHTLVPGCLILGTLMGELRAERLDICKYGVREGYLVERVLG